MLSPSNNINKKLSNQTQDLTGQFNLCSIEKFKAYLKDTDWSFIDTSHKGVDPNILCNEYLSKFTVGFNACFFLKPKLNWKHSPRKGWMTTGLVRSCSTKSILFQKFKCNPNKENEVAYIKYRNKLNSTFNKAEKNFSHKKISDSVGDQ